MNALTQARVHELLDYYPTTGELRWRKSAYCRPTDRPAGHLDPSDGYIRIGLDGRVYRAHRLIWFGVTSKWPSHEIDHINTIRHDNRWFNLREANDYENMANRPLFKNNKSGFKGVSWHKQIGCWRADITANGVRYYLGLFHTAEDAAKARYVAANKLHKEFGRVS